MIRSWPFVTNPPVVLITGGWLESNFSVGFRIPVNDSIIIMSTDCVTFGPHQLEDGAGDYNSISVSIDGRVVLLRHPWMMMMESCERRKKAPERLKNGVIRGEHTGFGTDVRYLLFFQLFRLSGSDAENLPLILIQMVQIYKFNR